MSVIAKFKCEEKKTNSVTLRAVVRDKENNDWSQYTPWGEIRMGIDNPNALSQFEVGEEYNITIIKSE